MFCFRRLPMETQLLIVEGIWGSGKTTLVDTLKRHLSEVGLPIRTIYDEAPVTPVTNGRLQREECFRPGVERLDQLVMEIQHSGEIALLEAPFLNCALLHFVLCNLEPARSVGKTLNSRNGLRHFTQSLIHLYHSNTDIQLDENLRSSGRGMEKRS